MLGRNVNDGLRSGRRTKRPFVWSYLAKNQKKREGSIWSFLYRDNLLRELFLLPKGGIWTIVWQCYTQQNMLKWNNSRQKYIICVIPSIHAPKCKYVSFPVSTAYK